MTNAILPGLALLLVACATAGTWSEAGPRAPPGWEPFCFPLFFEFPARGDSITPQTRELMATVFDMHFKQYEWFELVVNAGPLGSRDADPHLARRRAGSVVRLARQVGIRADRMQVTIEPLGELTKGGPGRNSSDAVVAAWMSGMIPPDQVREVRAAEAKGIAFC